MPPHCISNEIQKKSKPLLAILLLYVADWCHSFQAVVHYMEELVAKRDVKAQPIKVKKTWAQFCFFSRPNKRKHDGLDYIKAWSLDTCREKVQDSFGSVCCLDYLLWWWDFFNFFFVFQIDFVFLTMPYNYRGIDLLKFAGTHDHKVMSDPCITDTDGRDRRAPIGFCL